MSAQNNTPTTPSAATNPSATSLEASVQHLAIASNQVPTPHNEPMDATMEDAPPKLDSSNPDSIKKVIVFLQAKATKLTDAVINASFAPSTGESEKDESARLQRDLDQCENNIKMLQRRLENMGVKTSSPTVAPSSSDVTKQPQIPITEFLSFDPDFWKSYHLDPNVLNSIKPNQSKDVYTFLEKFEYLFEQYHVPLDAHWYRCLSKLIGECSYTRIFKFAFKEKKSSIKGKQVPFEWVKSLLTSRFDHSLERDAATSRRNLYTFVPRSDETFKANLTRFFTLLDWAGIDSQNCYDQCYFFVVSFKDDFRQELLDTILGAAREAKLPVALTLNAFAHCPTSKAVLDQLIPVNFSTFLQYFSTKWGHLNDQWRKCNKSKPASKPSSSNADKSSAKSSAGEKPQNSRNHKSSKRPYGNHRSDSDTKRLRRGVTSSSSSGVPLRIRGNCDKCRVAKYNKDHYDTCKGPYADRRDRIVEPTEVINHKLNLTSVTTPSSIKDDSNPPFSPTFSVNNDDDAFTSYLRQLDDYALGNELFLEDSDITADARIELEQARFNNSHKLVSFSDNEIIRKYWKRLGAPYKPKKGNVITNAPPSIPNHDDPSDNVHLGTVARIYKGIEKDIVDLFPNEVPSSSSPSSSSPKKRKYKSRNLRNSRPLRKSQRLNHKGQTRQSS